MRIRFPENTTPPPGGRDQCPIKPDSQDKKMPHYFLKTAILKCVVTSGVAHHEKGTTNYHQKCFFTNSATGRPSLEEPMKRVGLIFMIWLDGY